MIEYERLTTLKAIHLGSEIRLTQVKADSWHVEVRNPMGGVFQTLAHDEDEAKFVAENYFTGG